MKIGIALTGVSHNYQDDLNKRDWKSAKESLKEKLIDSFKDHEVITFLTTYYHPEIYDQIKFYNPKKVLLLDIEGSHQRSTYIESMLNLVNEPLDFIISTRFDVDFSGPVGSYNFDFKKFNCMFREIEPFWTRDRFTNDVLYGFPKEYLLPFIESINDEHINPTRPYADMHAVFKRVETRIGETNTNFLFKGTHNSSQNHFYRLIRA